MCWTATSTCAASSANWRQPKRPATATPLGRLHADFEAADGYTADARARKLLAGLGFTAAQMERQVGDFSGGWRMRLNLAQALMCPSDLLLLDEPTNTWIWTPSSGWKTGSRAIPGTLILISHDRDFLDAVVDHVVHLDQQKLVLYRGGYSSFERTRAERLAQQQQAYDKQQAQRAHMEKYIARFKAQATKARQAQSRIKPWNAWKSWRRPMSIRPSNSSSARRTSCPSVARPGRRPTRLRRDHHPAPGQAAADARRPHRPARPQRRRQVDPDQDPGRRTRTPRRPLQRGENLAIGYFAQHQLDSLDAKASPMLHLQRIAPASANRACATSSAASISAGPRCDEAVLNFSVARRRAWPWR